MIDNNVINKSEVLFINSEENNPSWAKEYRADNFNVLNIYQAPLSVNKKIFIIVVLSSITYWVLFYFFMILFSI